MNTKSNESSATTNRGHVVDGSEFTLEVFSPRVVQPKKFIWSKSLRVGEAADEAAKAFDYETGNPTFLNKDKQVLDCAKTLIEVGIQDFDQLELTDKGGGV